MTQRNLGLGSNANRLWRVGSELLREDQGLVLMAFQDRRYTRTLKPYWARGDMPGGGAWPVQFEDDVDWLAHTKFVVTMAGKLDKRSRECREEPTWPDNPELRGASLAAQAQFAPNLRYPGWSVDLTAEQALRTAEDERAYRGKTPEEILAAAKREGGE